MGTLIFVAIILLVIYKVVQKRNKEQKRLEEKKEEEERRKKEKEEKKKKDDIRKEEKARKIEQIEKNCADTPEAMYQLGCNFYNGENNTPKDKERAIFWLTKAAEKEYVPAITDLANIYIGKKDYQKARIYIEQSVKKEDTEGLCLLGAALWKGWGYEKNLTAAISNLKAAAYKGNKDAMFYLIHIYNEDTRNHIHAFFWSWQLAQKNDPRGLVNLGANYCSGVGVDVNLRYAYKFLTASKIKESEELINGINSNQIWANCVNLANQATNNLANSYFAEYLIFTLKYPRIDLFPRFKGHNTEQYLKKFRIYWNKQFQPEQLRVVKLVLEECGLVQKNQNIATPLALSYLELFYDKLSSLKNLNFYSPNMNKGELAFAIAETYDNPKTNDIKPNCILAEEWYEIAAKEGNAKAIDALARFYNNIKFSKDDLAVLAFNTNADATSTKEFYWTKKSAEAGNKVNIEKLAMYYLRGNGGVERNLEEALKWFKKINDSSGINAIIESNEWMNIITTKRVKTLGNNPQAMYSLAYDFHYGTNDVPKRIDDAIFWYEKAIDLGNVSAINGLAHVYSDISEYKDWGKAYSLYFKAANLGDLNSINNLGLCYQNGFGVTKNLKQALACYEKVNDDWSHQKINEIKSSKEWKDLISSERENTIDGSPISMFKIGRDYATGGNNMPIDINKALFWLEKSAEAGYDDAMCRLGKIYKYTDNINSLINRVFDQDFMKDEDICYKELDPEKRNNNEYQKKDRGFYWFKKSAENGNTYSMAEVGDCYHHGYGIQKDLKKAIIWYEKANTHFSRQMLKTLKSSEEWLDLFDYVPVTSEISVAVGADIDDDSPVTLRFDSGDYVHAFILGQSGSGKSVFLNNFISGAIRKYAPEDLILYLMDFKGVEFNRYQGVKHVKALMVDNSDPQMTLEVLRELKEENKKRVKLWQQEGVNNIDGYNKKYPNNRLPQVIFVADECQIMFSTSMMNGCMREIQREITDIINIIATQGRSQGIHMLLATQQLDDTDISGQVLKNLTECFILMSAGSDSERLVPDSRELTSKQPTGQACYFHKLELQSTVRSYYENNEALDKHIAISKEKAANRKSNGEAYFCGSSIFSYEAQDKQLLEKNSIDNPIAFVGKNIGIYQNPTTIALSNEYYENILFFGANRELQTTGVTLNALMTLIESYHTMKTDCKFLVVDFSRTTNPKYAKILQQWQDKGMIEILDRNKFGETMKSIVNNLKNGSAVPTVLTILGQENNMEMKRNLPLEKNMLDCGFESLGFNNIETFQSAFKFILDEGPIHGVHILLQVDKPGNILFEGDNGLNATDLFRHKIILHSENKYLLPMRFSKDIDVEILSDDVDHLRAYYYPEGEDPQLFTPYLMPNTKF